MEGPSLKSNLSLVSEMIAYIRHLESQMEESGVQASEDQKRIRAQQAAIAERETAVARAHGELRASGANSQKLSSELSACREEMAKVLARAVEAEARLEVMAADSKRKTTEWSEQSRRLSEQLRGTREVNLAIRSEVESLKRGFMVERESFKRNEATLVQKNRELIDKNRQVDSTAQALDQSVARLISARDEARTAARALQAQVDRMQATIQLLEGQLGDLRRNQGKSHEKARVAEDRGIAAGLQLARAEKRVLDLEAELRGMLGRQSTLEHEVATLRRSQKRVDSETAVGPGPHWS